MPGCCPEWIPWAHGDIGAAVGTARARPRHRRRTARSPGPGDHDRPLLGVARGRRMAGRRGGAADDRGQPGPRFRCRRGLCRATPRGGRAGPGHRPRLRSAAAGDPRPVAAGGPGRESGPVRRARTGALRRCRRRLHAAAGGGVEPGAHPCQQRRPPLRHRSCPPRARGPDRRARRDPGRSRAVRLTHRARTDRDGRRPRGPLRTHRRDPASHPRPPAAAHRGWVRRGRAGGR